MSHPIIKVKIDVTKIDKSRIFEGKKGKYIDVTLLPGRDGEDQYGNHYVVVQDVTKEERERGVKGPILGNAKILERRTAPPAQTPRRAPDAKPTPPPEEDDVPF